MGIYNGLPTTTQIQHQDACVLAPVLKGRDTVPWHLCGSSPDLWVWGPLNGLEQRNTGRGDANFALSHLCNFWLHGSPGISLTLYTRGWNSSFAAWGFQGSGCGRFWGFL